MSHFVTELLCTLDQIKLYHWQTKCYARHKTTDEFHEKFGKLVDLFVETYSGKYGRVSLGDSDNTIVLKNWTDESAMEGLKSVVMYLTEELPKFIDASDTDLYNIREDMLTEVHQTLYLFTFD